MSAGGPVGRRELAYRLFAAEYDDADLEYSASDEERAPNYVVTPTGARVNRLFVVGVLTEVESVSDEVLRARVVDPTGAFVVYAGQYQPDAVAFLESADVPSFVAVTGKARTFQPDGSDRTFTSVRPETMTAVDGPTRDRWTVQAAAHTLARAATMAEALDRPERGEDLTRALRAAGVASGLADGVSLAIDHYATTPAYLSALREVAVGAAEVVAGDRDAVPALDCAPADEGPVVGDLTAAPAVAGTLTEPGPSSGEPECTTAPPADEPTEPEPAATDAEPVAADVDSAAAEAGSVAPDDEPADADDEPANAGVEPAEGDAEAADAEPPDEPAAPEPLSSEADAESVDDEPTDDLGDFDVEPSADSPTAEPAAVEPDADEPYDLSDAEREATEAEFGTEFSTGREVGEPGEAGIATETPPPATEADTPPSSEAAASSDASAADEPSGDDESADDASVDLETASVDAMASLDEGDGADREAVVAQVVDEHGASVEAVEAAITEALLGGLCYEPADGRLKAI